MPKVLHTEFHQNRWVMGYAFKIHPKWNHSIYAIRCFKQRLSLTLRLQTTEGICKTKYKWPREAAKKKQKKNNNNNNLIVSLNSFHVCSDFYNLHGKVKCFSIIFTKASKYTKYSVTPFTFIHGIFQI